MALTGPTGESDPTMSMADPTIAMERRRRRERRWLIVVASLGVVFSIVVWSIARHDRLQASRHAFSEIATATAAAMALDIDRHIGVADDLAALFASSNDVSADEFERYVVSARRRAPAISALAWYRGQIVSPLREVPPAPGEMLPHDVDLMAARLERQVLVQARDVAGPEDETGQLSSGPPVEPSVMTRLVERALFSGATAVEPFGHPDASGPVTGLLFAIPVRTGGRVGGLDVVIGLIDAMRLVDDVGRRTDDLIRAGKLSLRPIERLPSAAAVSPRIYDRMPEGSDPSAWTRVRGVEVGDRLFRIKIAAGSDMPGRWTIEVPALAVLLAGFAVTGMAAGLLRRTQRRAAMLEDARAGNLATLRQLEAEIMAHDDTERRLVETVERLAISERRFRSTFDHAAVGIAHLSPAGTIERSNSRFATIFGLSTQTLRGRRVDDFVHPDDRPDWTVGVTALLSGQTDVLSTDCRVIRAGEAIWLRVTASLVRDTLAGGDDRLNHVIIVVDDVTEQTVMMRRLSLSERSLASAQRVAGLGIVEWDPATDTVWWSAETYRLFDRPPASGPLPFERLAEYVVAEDMALLDRALAHTVESGAPLRMDLRIRRPGEEPRWLRVEGAMEVDGGRRVLLAALLDATADRVAAQTLRRAKEQAEAANEAKSIFLANMSHELRTPLNAIIGFTEAMLGGLGGAPSDRHRGYLADVLSAGRHLLGVIESILDLSKIEAGKARLDESHADLGAIGREAVRLITPQAETRGVEVSLDLPDPAPVVLADRLKLRQLVLNLLSNAVKFSDTGGAVSLSVVRRKEGGVMLEVVDDGIGMDPEQIAVALQPFEQLAAGRGRGGGTGLGLPLARAIAELHGGRLEILSRPGLGTTVRVTLPAERTLGLDGAPEPPVAARKPTSPGDLPPGPAGRLH